MNHRGKKSRYDTIFNKFHSSDVKSAFCNSYRHLCIERVNSLVSLEISYCDAAAENGKPFSRATCHGKPVIKELYPFGSIFDRGVNILNSMIRNDKHTPINEEDEKLLTPLLNYLFDEKSHKYLKENHSCVETETQVMIRLATHYFSKLSVSKSFIMDKNASKQDRGCSCLKSEKEILDYFGDTSFGNMDVWHGTLDIMLGNCDIGVNITFEPEDISPGECASDEIKCSDLGSVSTRDKVLAQTITFSFLQKERHSLMMDNCLIPCILASSTEIQYFFYDCDNDILLQSRKYPLFIYIDGKLELSYQTILTTWLVLNYKYLCSEPTKYILDASTAGFPKFAGPALKIYKSNLKLQNVCVNLNDESDQGLNDPTPAILTGCFDSCPFKWPDEPFPSCPIDIV